MTTANPLAQDALFDRFFHGSLVAIAITTYDDFRFVAVNDAYCDLLGRPREQLVGRHTAAIGHLDDDTRARVGDALRQHGRLLDTPLTIHRPDGATRDILAGIQLAEWGGQTYAVSLYQDLSRHQRAQDALHSSQARFRRFFENLPVPLLIYRHEPLVIVDANPAACRLYGYPVEAMRGRPLADLWPPEARAEYESQAGSNPLGLGRQLISHHVTADGRRLSVHATTYPVPPAADRLRLAVVRDVTADEALQAALHQSEERLRLLAEVTTDAIWYFDAAAGVVDYGGGIETNFGHAPGPRPAPDWWLAQLHPDDYAPLQAAISRVLTSNRDRWAGQYRFRKADGHYATVMDRAQVLRDAGGRIIGMLGAMVDVSRQLEVRAATARATLDERRNLTQDIEQHVAQSLFGVSLLGEAARRQLAADDLSSALRYLDRLGDMARQALKEMRLLVFELRPSSLHLIGLVDALQMRLDAVERRAGVTAHVHADLRRDLPRAIQTLLYEAAQEALNNALRHAAADTIAIAVYSDSQQVTLAVRDNGRGFDPALLDTWPARGLADLRQSVHNLGGVLTIESRPAEGTVVQITLALQDGENGQTDSDTHL